jgi:hypothetical protein
MASTVAGVLLKETEELVPPTLFFTAGFCLIELTTQLVLDAYHVQFANYLLAFVGALVVGKAVLLANLLPFLHRFDTTPLIKPILFKTALYTVAVLIVRCLERVIEYLIGGGRMTGIPDYVQSHLDWDRIMATQIWVLVLFLIYTSFTELNRHLGKNGLVHLFLMDRPPKLAPPPV